MQRLDLRTALLRQLDRGRDHLLADRPELHRDEDVRELGLGQVYRRRRDPLQEALPALAPDEPVDGEPGDEPDRPAVARARVRDQGDHEDCKGEHRADDSGQRHLDPAQAHVEGSAVRPRELGLGEAKPDHGELCCGEGREHAEAEQAREEGDLVRQNRGPEEERDRDQRRGDDRLRRDERPAVEPAEGPRQLAVLAERVCKPREAGDRRRDRDEQDERARQPDVDAQRVHELVGDVPVQGVDDPEQRRVQPADAEVGRAVLRGEGREPDHRDRDVDHDDEPDP